MLTAFIVVDVAGKPYCELLHERLFKQISITAAHDAAWYDIVPNLAVGYRVSDGHLENCHWVARYRSLMTVVSTVRPTTLPIYCWSLMLLKC